jgi:hypothetical protein
MIVFLYAGLLALVYIALTFLTIKARLSGKVALGDGSNVRVIRASRAHGNFIEWTPLFLILLYFIESAGSSDLLIHVLGAGFLLARASHAFSLIHYEQYDDKGALLGRIGFRQMGMMVSMACVALMSFMLIVGFFTK